VTDDDRSGVPVELIRTCRPLDEVRHAMYHIRAFRGRLDDGVESHVGAKIIRDFSHVLVDTTTTYGRVHIDEFKARDMFYAMPREVFNPGYRMYTTPRQILEFLTSEADATDKHGDHWKIVLLETERLTWAWKMPRLADVPLLLGRLDIQVTVGPAWGSTHFFCLSRTPCS
jgi:hypothetical protein